MTLFKLLESTSQSKRGFSQHLKFPTGISLFEDPNLANDLNKLLTGKILDKLGLHILFMTREIL